MTGRVALVTGAAGDIGGAVAIRLARSGATVVLADLAQAASRLQEAADQVRAAGNGREPVVCHFDVTDEAAVDAAVAEIASTVGPADAVCNNAGYQGRFETTLDYDIDDVRRVMEINVVGVFAVLRACARELVASGRSGSIVNTASMAGVGGAPNMVAYSASKSAVIGLTKSAAKDLAPEGIRVNCISPAFIGPGMMWDRQVRLQAAAPSQYYADDPVEVEREMIAQVPLRRFGSLDEVARAVQFLLSDESSYITGFNLEVSGGAA